jgi:hypothetical protein
VLAAADNERPTGHKADRRNSELRLHKAKESRSLVRFVAARRRQRHGTRRALLFAANRTTHAPRYILELRVPAAELRQQMRRRVAFSKAGAARQHEGVLTKFVAEFGDLEVAHAPDFAACNLTRPSSSLGAAVLYMGPVHPLGKPTRSVSDIN